MIISPLHIQRKVSTGSKWQLMNPPEFGSRLLIVELASCFRTSFSLVGCVMIEDMVNGGPEEEVESRCWTVTY